MLAETTTVIDWSEAWRQMQPHLSGAIYAGLLVVIGGLVKALRARGGALVHAATAIELLGDQVQKRYVAAKVTPAQAKAIDAAKRKAEATKIEVLAAKVPSTVDTSGGAVHA